MKKMLAMLLALALALALTLGAAGAMAEGWKELSGSVEGSITLEAGMPYELVGNVNISGDVNVAPGETVKLMLSGKTLECKSIFIPIGAALELYDTGGGNIVCSPGAYGVEIQGDKETMEGGSLTMNGGTIRSEAQGTDAVRVYNGGTFTLNGGTIFGENCGVSNSGDFTMNGGKVTGGRDGVSNSGRFTLNDGEITGPTGVSNSNPFTMYGGTITGNNAGVVNYAAFTMHGGSVTGNEGVTNHLEFTMHGGSVTGRNGHGVENMRGNNTGWEKWVTFTMHGGSVRGSDYGVCARGVFRISAGTIEDSKPDANGYSGAVARLIGSDSPFELATAEETMVCLLPGSYIVSGGFREASVVVAKLPPAADLPQTGDPSSLLGWAMLLAASGAGLMLRRKK